MRLGVGLGCAVMGRRTVHSLGNAVGTEGTLIVPEVKNFLFSAKMEKYRQTSSFPQGLETTLLPAARPDRTICCCWLGVRWRYSPTTVIKIIMNMIIIKIIT